VDVALSAVFPVAHFAQTYDPRDKGVQVLAEPPDTCAGHIIEPIRLRRGGGPLLLERDGSLRFGLTPS
jgi:hypothetical protein